MSVINTALLSYGMSGRIFHAPFVDMHSGFNLVGSWERSTKRINEHYPAVKSYDTMEDLLTDDSVDLVVVNTPTLTHHEYAKKALESGKHVVVEKAFAGNTEEAVELRDLARDSGRKLAVFQNRRWDSDFLSVRDVIQKGVLGEIVEANLAWFRFDPALSPKLHKEQPSSGSGIVKDLGPHVIDQALVLFGMPNCVFADIGITRQFSEVDDYFDILLRYDDKRVHVKAGYFYKHPVPDFTLFGRKGSFLKRRTDVQEQQLDAGIMPGDPAYGVESPGSEGRLFASNDEQDEPTLITAQPGNYMEFYEGVYRSIAEGQPVPVTGDDGVRVMRVIDAAYQSQRDAAVVPL